MDPTTAGVAVVGFAASVVTLAGLITDSWQTLYNLRAKLKHASEDLRTLVDKLRALQLLITELEKTVANDQDVSIDIKSAWKEAFAQMLDDFSKFKTLVYQLKEKLDRESITGLSIRGRVKWVFSEELVANYNVRLASHIQFLEMIQGSIVGTRTLSLSQLGQANSHALQHVADETTRLHGTAQVTADKLQAGVGQCRSAIGAIFSEITDFRRSQRRELRESKRALITGLSVIETTQRGISRNLDTRQLTLEQIRGQVDQLVELEKASQPSSLSRHCCNQGHREGDRHYDRSKREVYLKYLSWRLPIGSLTTEITRSPHSHGKYGELDLDQCDHETSTYEFTFIAPAWLSTSIIQLSFKARSQHGLTNWNRNLSFGMHNYNTNPQLKKYLDAGDQAGLNRLFLEGKAKPTDYLPGGFTLLMVPLWSYWWLQDSFQLKMVQFLLEQGAEMYGQDIFPPTFCLDLALKGRAPSRWHLMALFLRHGASIPPGSITATTISSLCSDECHEIFDFQEHMLPYLDPLFMSELSQPDKWALVLAGIEYPAVRNVLKSCAQRYPASFSESFELEKSLTEIKQATDDEIEALALWVVSNGTHKMVELVFSEYLDPNLRIGWTSLLLKANLATAVALLDAGARPDHSMYSTMDYVSDKRACMRYIETATCYDKDLAYSHLIDKLIANQFTVFSHPPYSLDLYLGPELLSAVLCGNLHLVKKLIGHGASLAYEKNCYTPLKFAVLLGLVNIVATLLQAGSQAVQPPFDGLKILEVSAKCLNKKHPRLIPLCLRRFCPGEWILSHEQDDLYFQCHYWYIMNFFNGDRWIKLESDQAINKMLTRAFGHPQPTKIDQERSRPRLLEFGHWSLQWITSATLSLASPSEDTLMRTRPSDALRSPFNASHTALPTILAKLEHLGKLTSPPILAPGQSLIGFRRVTYWEIYQNKGRYTVLISILFHLSCMLFLSIYETLIWTSNIPRPPRFLVVLILLSAAAWVFI